MKAAQSIANRWYSQVAGVALIAMGITGLSLPTPTAALHGLEDKAIRQLAPVVSKTEIGKQMLAIYAARDNECHRSL
jgi:hypothetical protein